MGIRIKVITLTGITSSENRKISDVVPGDAVKLESVLVSSTGASAASGKHLGRLSLLLNNRASNPYHFSVRGADYGSMKSMKFLSLEAPLKPNSKIGGYYKDDGKAAAYPHTVRVYLAYYTK